MKFSFLHTQLTMMERLSYGFVLLPVLSEIMERGQLPYTGREFTTEILMGLVITLYILILHRVHKKLVKLEESRSRLVQLLVHDLKNPITGALGSISSLIQDSNDPHQRNKLLNIALINCRSEITLIDQILEIDRLEMAELSPRKQRVHIQAFLDSCVNEITGTAIFKDIHVSKSNTSSSAHLEADPDLLKRVMNHILRNALKYTPPGGLISLRAASHEDSFLLQVSDTGTGIAADRTSGLFNRFYRVEEADPSATKGLGLGLYFCKLAVEAHGGKIGIKSEEGKGTTVSILIPRDTKRALFVGKDWIDRLIRQEEPRVVAELS